MSLRQNKFVSRLLDQRPILSLLVIMIVIVIAGYVGSRCLLSWRVQEKLEDKSWPTSAQELHDWYHDVPSDKNAAPIYEKAFSAFKKKRPENVFGTLTGGFGGERKGLKKEDSEKIDSVARYLYKDRDQLQWPFSSSLRREMKRHLDRNAKPLRLLRKAADLPKCRYSIDFTKSSVRLVHFGPVGDLWRLCRVEAFYKASIGKTPKALDAVRTSIGLVQSLRREPTVLSQQLRSGGLSNVADTTVELVQRFDLTGEELIQLRDMWSKVEMLPGWKWASVGEFVLHVDKPVLYMMPGYHNRRFEARPTAKFWYFVYKSSGVNDMDRIRLIELFESFMSLYELPPEDRFVEAQKLKPSRVDINPVMVRTRYCVNELWEAAMGSVRLAAVKRLVLSTLHIELFRKQRGKLPDDLSQLSVPEETISDPYTGSKLKYRQHSEGTGYTLYSVGADKKADRGGKIEKSTTFSAGHGRSKQEQDIVVNMEV